MYLLLLWPHDIYSAVLSYSLLNSGIIGCLTLDRKIFLESAIDEFFQHSLSSSFFSLCLFFNVNFSKKKKSFQVVSPHYRGHICHLDIVLHSPSLLNLLFPKFCFPLLVLILHYKNPANHLARAESSLERGHQAKSAKARALFSI